MSVLHQIGRVAMRRVPPLRPVVHAWRARRAASRLGDPAADPPPVLVYQMGKVGSSTVARVLRAAAYPDLHVHSLEPETLRRVYEEQRRAGGRFSVGYTWHLSRAVQARLRCLGDTCRVSVITLVRDPIAREVSALFQSPTVQGAALLGADGALDAQRAVASLRARFSKKDACWWVFDWFQSEIGATLGVDVMAAPFPRERGWGIVEGARASGLVLRTEDLDRTLAPALRAFLGIEVGDVTRHRSNVRSETRDAARYGDVLSGVRLPRDAVERIYAQPFVRHFYPQPMLDAFIARWSE
ncbi:MAG TPA: putative capsular polysaccharide synthesis family protein [Myxococcota bacterium]